MSLNKSFNDTLNDWQSLVDNLKPHLTDLPNLVADHDSLSALIPQTRALQAQQDVNESGLRDVVAQRKALAAQARKARNRLVAGLQSAFDHESEKLLAFGIKPRARQSSLRLTKLQKAQNAVVRAAARVAVLMAANPPAAEPTPPPSPAVK